MTQLEAAVAERRGVVLRPTTTYLPLPSRLGTTHPSIGSSVPFQRNVTPVSLICSARRPVGALGGTV